MSTKMNIEAAKKQATILKEYISKTNQGISHSACLHAIARINGWENWNTFKAVL